MSQHALAPKLREILVNSPGTAYGLCVWENGEFTTEILTPANRCQNCYSVAKAFTATAIGMLVDRGKISFDDKVYPILQKYFPSNFDPKWKEVTVANMLLHRFGIEKPGFLDIDSKPMDKFPSTDFLAIVLGERLTGTVGETFAYTDAAYYVLSRIFTECSGERMDDFLRKELLTPLHFQEHAFSVCPQGYFMGATGFYLSTFDMAKLGVLYAQNGLWEGKRLLSEKVIGDILGHGYSLKPNGDNGSYTKGGAYGQLLYINPSTQRVVTVHGYELSLKPLFEFLAKADRLTPLAD